MLYFKLIGSALLAGVIIASPAFARKEGDDQEGRQEEKDGAVVKVEQLPKAVLAAVESALPGAKIVSAALEEEDEEDVYEIKTQTAGGEMMVMITPEGQLLEIEQTVAAKDLPARVSQVLALIMPKGETSELEKATAVVYVVEKTFDDVVCEIAITGSGKIILLKSEIVASQGAEEKDEEEAVAASDLPAEVSKSVLTIVPEASIIKAVMENEEGLKNYEVTIKKADGSTCEVMTTTSGDILEMEAPIQMGGLPSRVKAALESALPGGKIKEIEMKHVVVYEAKKEVGEQTYEVQIDAGGRIQGLTVEAESGEEDVE